MTQSLIIRDARIATDGGVVEGDVAIRGNRIERVGGALSAACADAVIEADGKLLLPGLIDDHVHFREPGLTHKADIAHESRAAIAGGVTSFMDMPNTLPPTTCLEVLREKSDIAARTSVANYAFYLGATCDNLEEIRRAGESSACGVKLFLGATTGNMLVEDSRDVERVLEASPLLVAVHCEDSATIARNAARIRATAGENPPFSVHPEIRSAEACFVSTARAIDLARSKGARLHVLHVSTADELALFEEGPLEGKPITAEVCVHHLWFDAAAYDTLGARIKCNPAIKSASHRDALREALARGTVDVIGTDHAPHLLSEKSRGYFESPSGIPYIQHALPALLELHLEGHLAVETIVERACHAPARLFGVRDRGFIREGFFADLVLVDLNRPTTVCREGLLSKCSWSPFEGTTFHASIDTVFVNGAIAFENGRVRDGVRGLPLEFSRPHHS